VAALAVGTALLCEGSHLALWIIGRILQGAAAAVIWTTGMALLVNTFANDLLGQAMGYSSMATVAGTTTGPLLGGILYEHGGYYAPFALAFGLIGIDFFLRVIMIDPKEMKNAESEEPRDHSGESTEEEKHDNDHSNPLKEEERAGSKACDRHSRPSSDDESPTEQPAACRGGRFRLLFSSPRMFVILWVYLLVSVTVTSFDSVLPLFVRDTFGWGPTAQGLIFIPLMVPNILDPVSGYLIDRWPAYRRFQSSIALFAVVPVLVCMRYVTENSMRDKVLLCALLALVGACIGFLEPPIMVEISCMVEDLEAHNPGVFGRGGATALAYGISNSAFAAGSMIGPFIGGFIRDRCGWATMSWTLAVPLGISGVLVLLFIR
jgi:MFS family permease